MALPGNDVAVDVLDLLRLGLGGELLGLRQGKAHVLDVVPQAVAHGLHAAVEVLSDGTHGGGHHPLGIRRSLPVDLAEFFPERVVVLPGELFQQHHDQQRNRCDQ